MLRFLLSALFAGMTAICLSAETYEAYIDSADNYSSMERWRDAARCYRKALSIKPASPLNSKLFANLGICHTRIGEYDEALRNFDIALVKEPDSPHILTSRASALLLADNVSAAIADLEHAIRTDSLYTQARKMHGQLMLVKGDTDSAEKDFNIMARFDPAEAWGHAGMGEVLLTRGKYDEAITMFSKAISIEDTPDFRISLISALIGANKLADAESSIRESIRLYPREGSLYLSRAILHKMLHQNNDAELDCKLAKEYGIDPQTIEKFLPEFTK